VGTVVVEPRWEPAKLGREALAYADTLYNLARYLAMDHASEQGGSATCGPTVGSPAGEAWSDVASTIQSGPPQPDRTPWKRHHFLGVRAFGAGRQ
jgi:hypothetical protein